MASMKSYFSEFTAVYYRDDSPAVKHRHIFTMVFSYMRFVYTT